MTTCQGQSVWIPDNMCLCLKMGIPPRLTGTREELASIGTWHGSCLLWSLAGTTCMRHILLPPVTKKLRGHAKEKDNEYWA